MAEDIRAPVASTSSTSETSKTPEPIINKIFEYIKPNNKKVFSIFPIRQQREKRPRKWAIDHSEDPDVFITITEKDINLSQKYQDRIIRKFYRAKNCINL
ncbi:hypothetical protein RclHR1_16690001 [Rhizophagus clarus]|uniref:Uncharacterized protein n=1 Tax=Rhizophagus clarus TaxID=94130 RepID=A0A2Z6QI44_9GLOM|nr:hypothetical protein RclHR1_16690001 [Rhizophagus clarus]GES94523.1 hypothetical protein GLOIN_2v1814667 [Rhizophagus clarus]